MTQTSIDVKALASALVMHNITLLLKCFSWIYYQLHFEKNLAQVQALLDFGDQINIITRVYLAKLRLKFQHTNIIAQKLMVLF